MTSVVLSDFNDCAAQYNQHAEVQREAAAWLAEWLPDSIHSPALELGAGTGLFTHHLAKRVKHLEATDFAPQMVRLGAAAFPNVRWTVAEAQSPPPLGPYAGIFSCSLVQWLPTPAETFRHWHQISAPGARLIAGWFVQGTLDDFFEICPEATPFVWKTADTWLSLLEQNGWRVLRHEVRHFVRHYPHATTMLRAIHNVGAIVPHRLGTARLRQVLRAYDQNHSQQGRVASTFAFLRVEAETHS